MSYGRIEALGGDANGTGGAGGGGRISLISGGLFHEGNVSVEGGTNPDLSAELQGQDGVYAKITAPSLPSVASQSFNYDTLIPALSLGLTAGYEYTIKGLPFGLKLEELQITGTPVEAGEFNATLFASNRFGDANVSFSIEVAPGNPSVLTLPAGNIGSTTALLHADILDTGGEVVDLSFIYGESADNLTSSSTSKMTNQTGSTSLLLTGLENNTTYYFQAQLSNTVNDVSGNNIYSFTTLIDEVSPLVQLIGTSDVTDSNLTVHYELISYDAETPDLTIFWGPVDQGQLSGLWEENYELGEVNQTGTGSHLIQDLTPGETIFFRIRAQTSNKISWSETALKVKTVGLPGISTLPPIDQTANSATVRGKITSTGGELTKVTLNQPLIDENLIAHWRFDEGQGIHIEDSTGNYDSGIIHGGVLWKPSHSEDFGTALDLVGDSLSYVELPTFELGGALTLSGWFHLNNFGDNLRAIDFANEGDLDSILLTTSGNGNDGNWSVIEGNELGLGWSSSQISNDADSGISSDYAYTSAVNLHGTNRTINGVLFTGTTASSGNGWDITSGFQNYTGSSSSTVSGQVGTMLTEGFKFAGDPLKLKLTGLIDGQAYIFSLYSKAWSAGDRTCTLSCSDLSESFTVNQDQYHGQTPDGLLVECHYIAQGTEVEFTIDPIAAGTWHLYAFSNREAELDRTIVSSKIDDLWSLQEWQHVAVSVEEDGHTDFYSDGQLIGSFTGDTPADINRSYHILGGNRLWMDKFDPSGLEDLKLWLDARFGLYLDANGSNLASAEDDKVAVWKDFSGNGYDAASIEGSPN